MIALLLLFFHEKLKLFKENLMYFNQNMVDGKICDDSDDNGVVYRIHRGLPHAYVLFVN